eukprot:12914012-Alexandrium_andersonii.AAC.1
MSCSRGGLGQGHSASHVAVHLVIHSNGPSGLQMTELVSESFMRSCAPRVPVSSESGPVSSTCFNDWADERLDVSLNDSLIQRLEGRVSAK